MIVKEYGPADFEQVTLETRAPPCEMVEGCVNAVTHIGHKGYVYCAEHAALRRSSGYERCRKMLPWELRLIRRGEPLPAY